MVEQWNNRYAAQLDYVVALVVSENSKEEGF